MRAALVIAILTSGCAGHGDTCSRSMRGIDDCAPGLTCTAGDGETGVCVCASVEPTLGLGDECTDRSACASCQASLRCNRGSTVCIEPRSTAAGATCAEDDDCVVGLLCGDGSEKCEPPNSHDAGDRCGRSRECAGGLICGTDQRCGIPGGDGASCSLSDHCAPGFTCDTPLDPHRCRPLGVVGSLCIDATQCEAGLVCSSWFAPAQCALGATGERCLVDDDCQNGTVCATNVCF